MKEKNEIGFEDLLREKLDGFTVELPDDDWDAFERRMNCHARQNRPRGVWLRRARRIAVAACVAALVGGLWFFSSDSVMDVKRETVVHSAAEMTASTTADDKQESLLPAEERADAVLCTGDKNGAAGVISRRLVQPQAMLAVIADDDDGGEKEMVTDSHDDSNTGYAVASDDAASENVGNRVEDGAERMTPEEAAQLMMERDREMERMVNARDGGRRKPQKDGARNIAVGLLAALDPTAPIQGGKPINQVILNGNLNALPASPNIGEKKETHNLPVSVGVDVSIEVYKNLDIRTGLTYTGLYSTFGQEFKSGSERTRSQQLHYIGIPLSLSYRFWNGRVLNTYASLGGMCEKGLANVSREKYYDAETGQTVDERRDSKGIEGLQWLLTANVGIGVRIYKGLSFYAEPGFTWYIPNNVHPQPISLRTKSPYNFSIKTGLRVQI